jgi:hypothetical protein
VVGEHIRVIVFLGQRPQVPVQVPVLLLLSPSFLQYSFLVHHLANREDRHLLVHGNGLRLVSRIAGKLMFTFAAYFQDWHSTS